MIRFLTTTAIVAVAMTTAASAHAEPAHIRFDIRPSDTATALNSFARQAGVHVVFPYDAAAGRRVAALRGSFTRDAALRRLIVGQGLVIAVQTASMISLKIAPVETPKETASTTAADIVVLGQGQSRQVQTVLPPFLDRVDSPRDLVSHHESCVAGIRQRDVLQRSDANSPSPPI